ncbi:MAG: AI-2E family transporter [Campylobacterales bacterium]
MTGLVQKWYKKYFVDEEAAIFVLLLLGAMLTLFWLGGTLAPFLTALVFAYMLQGIVSSLSARGVRPFWAVMIAFGLFMGGLLAVLLLVLPLVWHQGVNLLYEIPGMIAQLKALAQTLPQRYPNLFSAEQVAVWINDATSGANHIGQKMIAGSFAQIPTLVGVIIYVVLVPILIFFLLKDRQALLQTVLNYLPKKRTFLTAVWHETDRQMGNYIRGKGIEIAIVAVVTYITFAALGLDYTALLAIVVGFSVLIPYIGAAVATLPVAAVAFFQFGVGDYFFYVLAAYAVIQALDGNVLVPILFSEAVSLHPVSIILAVLVFGGMWGFWGVFFAIPLATFIKAIVTAWPIGIEEVSHEADVQGGLA